MPASQEKVNEPYHNPLSFLYRGMARALELDSLERKGLVEIVARYPKSVRARCEECGFETFHTNEREARDWWEWHRGNCPPRYTADEPVPIPKRHHS